QLAQKSIQYKLDNEIKANELREEDNLLLQSNYKEEALNKLTEEQLVDVILSQPSVIVQKRKSDEEGIESSIVEMKPLTNLTFCRDQQITTRKGVVIGSMRRIQREIESQVMEFVFKKLNIPIIHRLPKVDGEDRLCLEGGDFLPAGDHCFIGCGLRTNKKAIEYMLKHDLFGTETVVVVEDRTDCHMDRMHLDTVFSIADEKICILSDDISGPKAIPKRKRIVTEYKRIREKEKDQKKLIIKDKEKDNQKEQQKDGEQSRENEDDKNDDKKEDEKEKHKYQGKEKEKQYHLLKIRQVQQTKTELT
ncbi:MAG: Arginine deiminase, partial [Streblomastix strix]